MISIFWGARQDFTLNPLQLFSNYVLSEIEHLEEQHFLTFRNETVKLLSQIQNKARECKRQVTTNQKVTTFQLPEETQATARYEYILTIPDTQEVLHPLCNNSDSSITASYSDCKSPITEVSISFITACISCC